MTFGSAHNEEEVPGYLRSVRHGGDPDPAVVVEFQRRYREELSAPDKQPLLQELAARARQGTVTFVYAAKDPRRNSAVLLRQYLEEHGG